MQTKCMTCKKMSPEWPSEIVNWVCVNCADAMDAGDIETPDVLLDER